MKKSKCKDCNCEVTEVQEKLEDIFFYCEECENTKGLGCSQHSIYTDVKLQQEKQKKHIREIKTMGLGDESMLDVNRQKALAENRRELQEELDNISSTTNIPIQIIK